MNVWPGGLAGRDALEADPMAGSPIIGLPPL